MAHWTRTIPLSCVTVGLLRLLVPPAMAAPLAYVPYSGAHGATGSHTADGVAVIDLATSSVVTRIPIAAPDRWIDPAAVAVTPDGSRAYVVGNGAAGSMSVIDTASNAVVESVDLGEQLKGVATTPDGCRAYVVTAREIGTVDLATNRLVDAVSPDDASSFADVAIGPDGRRAYALDWFHHTVFVLDVATGAFVDTDPAQPGTNPIALPDGGSPARLRLAPDGARLYVAQSQGTTVAVVDTVTNRVVATPGPFPSGALSVAIRGGDGRVFVGGAAGDLHAMDSLTLAPVQLAGDLVGELVDLAVTPDGMRVAALDATRGLVAVIDAASGAALASVDVDGEPSSSGAPRAIAIATPSGSHTECPAPPTTTLAPTTTTTVPTTTSTTLPPPPGCDTARACLEAVAWTTLCGAPMPVRLGRTIARKLPAALALLAQAADESRSGQASRLARRARHDVQAIVRAGRRAVGRAGDPVVAACRAGIGSALQPGLQRIAERRY